MKENAQLCMDGVGWKRHKHLHTALKNNKNMKMPFSESVSSYCADIAYWQFLGGMENAKK